MRPALLLCMVSTAALAEDARVAFLAKQLAEAKDPRLKTQTVLLLGQTLSEDAVAPLCAQLKDADPIVRGAAANALGDLRSQKAVACMQAAMGETDASVRSALTKSVGQGYLTSGTVYFAVEPVQDKVGGLPAPVLALAAKLLHDKLATLGALAPPNEDKKVAAALVKARALRAFLLRAQLSPGTGANGLKFELLIMTYPDQSLQGTWNVKGAHPKQETLLKAMVPKVVDDAAGDLQWTR